MPSVNEQIDKSVDQLTDEHVVQIKLDPDCKRILEKVGSAMLNSYVNEAIKAFHKSTEKTAESDSAKSPADLARAQMERIFGSDFAFIDCQNVEGHGGAVLLVEVKSKDRAQCEITDAIDILKSLRQPITHTEVWEIMKAIAVA